LRLLEDDDSRELRDDLVRRLRNILSVLIAAVDISGVSGPPGWRLHQLKGDRADLRYPAGRNSRPRFGGLPLMSRAPSRIAMAPPHPGAFVREEILDELGLSVSAAAQALDVRRATLSDLINGNAALSAEMALRIEKAFGLKMETLLNMQAWHDAHAMRQRADEINVPESS
jgi:addiction module HigA family antidote